MRISFRLQFSCLQFSIFFSHSNEFALIMSSFHEKGQELINQAEQGEWNLACDEKLLELMQNVASVS